MAHIPFAYPPLGFYVAASLNSLTHIRLEETFRWVPFIFSLGSIGAFFAFSRAILRSEWACFAATLSFALLPEPIHWMLMGGGLTRSLGLLFALLALRSIHRVYSCARKGDLILGIAFASALVLSHPQMAWFVLYSAAFMALFFVRTKRSLYMSLLLGLGVIALTSPWWIAVVTRTGLVPYLASTRHGWPIFSGLARLFLTGGTNEPFVPLVAFAALLGAMTCLSRRSLWLPTWLVVIFALDGWVPTTTGAVPIALLAGVGVADALWPLLARIHLDREHLTMHSPTSPRQAIIGESLVITLGFYILFSSIGSTLVTLSCLSTDEREAMRWISKNTPASSRFLVITSEHWAVDRSSEWFPALAERHSVGTVQGTEWLTGGEFSRRLEWNAQLNACVMQGATCIDKWIKSSGNSVTHIYIPKRQASLYSASFWQTERPSDCCANLRQSLSEDFNYRLIYDNPGASVYLRQNSVPLSYSKAQ